MPAQPICGVYRLYNPITNKTYYGSGKDVLNRKAYHFCRLRKNDHKNWLMQADFDRYGEDSFEFEIVEQTSLADRRMIEGEYVRTIPEADQYNICKKTTGGGPPVTAETLERMRAAHRDKKHSPETIAKLRARPAETNGGFIGYFHVPAGTYPSAYQAEDAMDGVLNFTTIRRWCKSPDKPFTIHSYKRSAYLKGIGKTVIGMTPRDLGFSFTPKVS